LDIDTRKLELRVSDDELNRRKAAWNPAPDTWKGGYQRLYIDHVLQADRGADLDFLVGGSGSRVPRDNH
jgi:dihydroxy-acid dehydratase